MKINVSAICPLCGGEAELFWEMPEEKYHKCGQCRGVFKDKEFCVSREAEKKRYEEHNNDVDDPRYQKFVEPLVAKVRDRFDPQCKGLDYGAGTGPVITKILRGKGYSIELYDPYFWNDPEALGRKYDFIVCCEVIEHFNAPGKEFELLRSLLNPGGALFCMTDLYSEDTDFNKWYYRNDPTHVFFYHEKTLSWIKLRFGFVSLERKDRLAVFSI